MSENTAGKLNVVAVIVILFILGAIGGVAVVAMGYFPVNADADPPALEKKLASFAKDPAIHRGALDVPTNPLEATPANLTEGMKAYKDNCMECHGGPNGRHKTFGRSMYPPAPNFTEFEEDLSDQEMFWIVKHGIRLTGMPTFAKMVDSDTQIWQMVTFIKHMKKLPPAVEKEWTKK